MIEGESFECNHDLWLDSQVDGIRRSGKLSIKNEVREHGDCPKCGGKILSVKVADRFTAPTCVTCDEKAIDGDTERLKSHTREKIHQARMKAIADAEEAQYKEDCKGARKR